MISRFLSWLKPAAPLLSPAHAARLASLRQGITPGRDADLEQARIVVVDVESTGLSLANDHLIAIGAVAIQGGRIVLADSFEIVLRQDVASGKDNILVHGIGGSAQREGVAPEEALLDFLQYLDGAPLLAYHVAFDETMLRKAYRKYLGFDFRHGWADLAYVLPALFPETVRRCHALDDWLKLFHIDNDARHNALADALATAQLGLMALRAARAQKLDRFRQLQEIEKGQRWLGAAG